MPDCIEEIRKRYKQLDEKTITSVVGSIKETLLKEFERANKDPNVIKRLREKTIKELEMAAEFRAKQTVAKKRAKQFLDKAEFKDNPQDAFLSKAWGTDYLVKGGNDSFAVNRQTIRDRHLNMLDRGVREHYSLISDGKSDEAIANAIDKLNKKQSIDGLPKHIKETAQAIHVVNKSIVGTLQENGVTIRERADYIARQSHNRDKIMAAADPAQGIGPKQDPFTVWSGEILPRLDPEKTFGVDAGNGEKQIEILKEIYNDIVSGDFENSIGNFGGKRVLHFNSGTDWAQYNAKYGHGTLLDSIVTSINSASKAGASARVLGPNGKEVWDHMEKAAAARMTPAEKAKFMDTSTGGQKDIRDNWLKEMYGYELHPGRELLSKFQRTASLLQAAAKVTGSLPSQFTDLAFSTMNFRAATGEMGVGFGAEMKAIKSFLTVLPKAERDFWANNVDMYFGDLQAEAYDRWGGFNGGGRSGFFEKFSKGAMSLSGLERQSSTGKTANARLFSMELGSKSKKSWAELEPRLRAGLERFSISEAEWGTIKAATQEYRPGAVAITPEGIRALDIPSKKKNDLALKLANYLGDMARVGSLEATGRERSIIAQGFSPDDPMGVFLRLAGQFKSFALAVPRVLRRIGNSNPEFQGRKLLDGFRNIGDASLLAATMTEVTLLSAVGMMAKDAMKGKDRDIDAKFLAEAFATGAMPLSVSYTLDALRGEYDGYGRSILKDLAGPTFGQTDDVVALISGAARMDSKVGIKALRLIESNTPGINLPFAKAALNKLFLTDLHEALNPGYELRLRQRAMHEGTDFLFNPF